MNTSKESLDQLNNKCDEQGNNQLSMMMIELSKKVDSVVEQQMVTNDLLRDLINIFKPQSVDDKV